MARPGTVTGWKLPRNERELLLQRFQPKYENVIADHVTLRTGANPSTPLPRKPEAWIVGRAALCERQLSTRLTRLASSPSSSGSGLRRRFRASRSEAIK